MNPVGVTEVPQGYETSPRRYGVRARAAAAAVLAAFAFVGTVTTVASLGAWCLTSDAGNHQTLPDRLGGGAD